MGFYVLINDEKHYIDPEIVQRSKLKAGDVTPYTGLTIQEDARQTRTESSTVN